METPSLKDLALQVLERNRAGNSAETSGFQGGNFGPESEQKSFPAKKWETQPEGVSQEWLDGIARLRDMAPPSRFPAQRWQLLKSDAARFIEEWGEEAAWLGWTKWELFGCHATRPADRLDMMGLVPLLKADRLVELTGQAAVIQTRSGARLTFPKWPQLSRPQERRLVWELAD